MRKAAVSIMAATFVLAAAIPTGPAAATKASTVASACVARSSECRVTTEGGGNKYCFDNSKSGQGTQCVSCPSIDNTKTDCTMAASAGGRKGTSIEGVIRAPARKAAH